MCWIFRLGYSIMGFSQCRNHQNTDACRISDMWGNYVGERNMDRRIKRTKQAINDCLLTLLEKKPIEKITVKELCQLADINRSTFYQYYDNPPSMLCQIQSEIMEQLKAYLLQSSGVNTSDKILEMMRYLYLKKQYAQILLGTENNVAVLSSLLYIVYDNDVEAWKKRYPDMADEQIYYLFAFAANGKQRHYRKLDAKRFSRVTRPYCALCRNSQ